MPDFPATANPNQLNGLVITLVDNPAGGPIVFVPAGDFDGDGLPDNFFGLPDANAPSGNQAGRVIGIGVTDYGARPGNLNLGEALPPQNPGDALLQDFFAFSAYGGGTGFGGGISVASADVNGDGRADLITGASGANGGAGSVYVYLNPGSVPGTDIPLGDLDGTTGFEIFGDAGFQSGVRVTAGDFNGDGFADVVTATPGRNGGAGGVSVVYGGPGPFSADFGLNQINGTNGFNVTGFAAGDGAGGSGVVVGDVNDDGFDDLIIGSRFADPSGRANAGQVNVVFGTAAGIPANFDISTLDGTNGFSFIGSFPGQQLSWALSGGDFNGDRFFDIIASAPPTNNFAGGAAVLLGHAGPFDPVIDVGALNGTNGFFINGVAPGDSTGVSVFGGIDINGDGYDDILISAPDTDAPGNAFDAGSLFTVFGRPTSPGPTLDLSTLDGTNGFRFDFLDAGFRGGVYVGGGDLDGDGLGDVFSGNQANGDGIIIYGVAPTEAVVRNGSAADQRIFGGDFIDTLNGGGGDDVLIGGGEADILNGGDGSDAGILDVEGDQFDGGAGIDTGVVLGTGAGPSLRNNSFNLNLVDTEVALIPSLTDPRFGVPPPGYSPYQFTIVIPDASVIAGNRLEVIATELNPDEGLAIDASAVAGGGVWVFTGPGANNHIGGAGSDAALFGASGIFISNNTFDGGGGIDTIGFRGNYVGGNAVVFEDDSLAGVEVVAALTALDNPFGGLIDPNGFDYDFTLANGNVAAGQTLDLNGTALGANETLTVDGSLVMLGTLRFFGGQGDDNFTGGANGDLFYGGLGGDTQDGGPGANIFFFRDVMESTPANPDLLIWNNGDGSDTINVAFIDADTTQDGNQDFQYIGGAAFSGAGQIRFEEMNPDEWMVEGDVNGDGVADFRFDVFAPDFSGGVFVG